MSDQLTTPQGVRLGTINHWLRKIGLVLVVDIPDDGGPIRLWVERASRYDLRCELQQTSMRKLERVMRKFGGSIEALEKRREA